MNACFITVLIPNGLPFTIVWIQLNQPSSFNRSFLGLKILNGEISDVHREIEPQYTSKAPASVLLSCFHQKISCCRKGFDTVIFNLIPPITILICRKCQKVIIVMLFLDVQTPFFQKHSLDVFHLSMKCLIIVSFSRARFEEVSVFHLFIGTLMGQNSQEMQRNFILYHNFQTYSIFRNLFPGISPLTKLFILGKMACIGICGILHRNKSSQPRRNPTGRYENDFPPLFKCSNSFLSTTIREISSIRFSENLQIFTSKKS